MIKYLEMTDKEDSLQDNLYADLIFAAAKTGNVSFLHGYIDSGYCVNVKHEHSGYTPLHIACAYGHIDFVKSLFEIGNADPWILDNNERYAIDLATEQDFRDIIGLLRDEMYGCDPIAEFVRKFGPRPI
ncbi:ankyrin repeat domain-containing protein [Parvularcula sp. LCG005]|uniref:ankyrin repeat domain-containing protein n=1 Tax=Parvularcula sp. LCG005 TaxID=3078805 RepID=UPI0029430723|nr:ankyrin repeat domain-containing protein [Parvularcula sp. LCG005]WOI52991.1 ankyrin repeat domain-containing protein [Parvularcula sp. LCG005]